MVAGIEAKIDEENDNVKILLEQENDILDHIENLEIKKTKLLKKENVFRKIIEGSLCKTMSN